MALALRVFLKSWVSVVPAFLAIFLSFNVNADWVNTAANVYECTSGTCAFSCTTANQCEDNTFIATRTAASASVTCFGEASCLDAEFYLAAKTNTVACSGTNSCNNAQINVGVPDSGVITAAVPATFSQSDFFGLINSFSLNCTADLACVGTNLVSYYEITDQNIYCVGETNVCQNLNIDAYSTIGDVSISCETATSCNTVTFDTAAVTSGCIGDFCSQVTHTVNTVPTPDVDGDGVLDVNDLCPTGLSVITDVAPTDGCDDETEIPDSDGDGVPDVLDGLTLEWVGPFFLGDFFDEGNWEDDGVDAAADVINPSQVIGREIVISNAALTIPNNTNIFLGEGNSLTLDSGTLGAGTNTQFHPLSVGGDGSASIVVKGRASFNMGLAWDIAWSMEDSGRLTSANSDFSTDTGVFGKSSSVNFVGGETRVILTAISVSDAQTMLEKFTVDGAAAVLDSNLIIKSNGDSGSIVLPDFDEDGFGGPEDICPFSLVVNSDFDGDGCDDATEDLDDDNDDTPDLDDAFPLNNAADTDTDGDDLPDDWLYSCNFDCQNNSGLTLDNDDDNDGVLDTEDAFPMNFAAWADTDMDGFPDFWNPACDATCQNNSGLTLDPVPNDVDSDGVPDAEDAFPLIFAAWADADMDGFPDFWNTGCDLTCQNNSGLTLDPSLDDFDNDGVIDSEDAFPNDPERSKKKKSPDSGSLFYLLALGVFVLRKRYS